MRLRDLIKTPNPNFPVNLPGLYLCVSLIAGILVIALLLLLVKLLENEARDNRPLDE